MRQRAVCGLTSGMVSIRYSLANGIPVRPEAVREIRIHDRDKRGTCGIRFGQQSPTDERNPHRLKVAGRHRTLVDCHVRKIAEWLISRDISRVRFAPPPSEYAPICENESV